MEQVMHNEQYPTGIKWTKQRKDVYQVLMGAKEPMSAQEIYAQIVKSVPDTGYAVSTIYRILTAFEEKNMVIKSVLMDGDAAVYEWNRGGHTHYAICLNCHKRIPLKNCPIGHMHMPVDNTDFMVTGHKVEVYGYCKTCKE